MVWTQVVETSGGNGLDLECELGLKDVWPQLTQSTTGRWAIKPVSAAGVCGCETQKVNVGLPSLPSLPSLPARRSRARIIWRHSCSARDIVGQNRA